MTELENRIPIEQLIEDLQGWIHARRACSRKRQSEGKSELPTAALEDAIFYLSKGHSPPAESAISSVAEIARVAEDLGRIREKARQMGNRALRVQDHIRNHKYAVAFGILNEIINMAEDENIEVTEKTLP